ncbi:intermembrane transport protein PqiB [Thiofilum flexile]|uniref:PqiB family protein n=1 Tax=Thiofilum flexile TaxID=125627 RepID=UPI000367BD0D|nr:MlaD family protein [Thiofilum flexile]
MAEQPVLIDAPLPVAVQRSRWPSPIWLIPLLALGLAGWLLYTYWYQQGPSVEVYFNSAEGIVEGQTVVRYKHVVVGRVEQVSLAARENSSELLPVVKMRLNKEIQDLMNCNAQFWVVRPRIKGAEVSGLGTLFSGSYIGLQPRPERAETDDGFKLCYQALEDPPPMNPERPGRQFILEADSVGSIDNGTPIFYKQLRVGEVVDYRLVRETGKFEVRAFIDDPYYTFVNPNSRFWNAGGLDFKMSPSGAEFRMESLSALLIGGIAFDAGRDGESADSSTTSKPNSRFHLFKDYKSSQERLYRDKLYYVMHFSGSVRGLAVGASVEYQGVPVGKVEAIEMDLDPSNLQTRIPVRVVLEPQRFAEDITLEQAQTMLEKLVEQGVRAKLQNGNILTGQAFINLVQESKASPERMSQEGTRTVFPTSSTSSEDLTRIALDIANDLKSTVASVRRFMDSKQLDHTVTNANELIDDTQFLMRDARKAVADLRVVLQTLENETLPKASHDFTSVANSINKAIPQLNHDVTSVANSINKAIPQASHDLTSVANSINKAIPRASHDLTSVANSVNKAIPQFSHDVTSVANSVNKALPVATNSFAHAANNLSKALPEVQGDVRRVSNDLVQTMRRLQNSLGHMDKLLAQNSPTQYQLMEMMQEVTTAARAIRDLSERLERKPDSLIRGRRE